MLLLVLAAHALTGDEALLDLRTALASPTSAYENRIGFAFATLCIDDEAISGSRSRLLNVARVMSDHKELLVQVEGHVGTSAPDEIAQEYSEARAHIVAQVLEHEGVEPSRIRSRGWSNRVSLAALHSQDPMAALAEWEAVLAWA